MPAKNRIKAFEKESIYYIYNKGIDGRAVFLSTEDYEFFEKTAERYLNYVPEAKDERFKTERPYILRHKQEMNLQGKLEMMAYCLNPQGVKFLVLQHEAVAMTQFMRRCMTNYVMYYNRKYQRRGFLFEGSYRAVVLREPEEVVMVSRLIHQNNYVKPVRRFGIVETTSSIDPEEYLYSSLGLYLNKRVSNWVRQEKLQNLFDQWNNGRWKSYREFIADPKVNMEELTRKLGIE